jgi:hypothetical protein
MVQNLEDKEYTNEFPCHVHMGHVGCLDRCVALGCLGYLLT